ncbi:MAG: glycogen debranching protein [Bacteroidetes bacterium]|nr:glycogen debranching protein [Bacteroidota bacterium]NCQ10964.1 glycogen debranching protein [Bacteroidota bacterium]
MLTFNSENSKETLTKEWLITNGIGGYASSTLSGANTRRYHGLLVASLNPPIQRQVLVSKIEESLLADDGTSYNLSSNYFPGVIHPKGYIHIESFNRKRLAETVFNVNGNRLKKTIFMVHGSNTTILEYENMATRPIGLVLNPFYVNRDYHSLYHETSLFSRYIDLNKRLIEITSNQYAIPVYLKYSCGQFTEEQNWYRNYHYLEEQHRGLDDTEDAYSIGKIELQLNPGEVAYITFSTDIEMAQISPKKAKKQELKRLNEIVQLDLNDEFLSDLIVAANQFIVDRKTTAGKSIIAGYHWFTDWGRDTMIAMLGLCIATGDQATSKSILSTFLNSLDQGLLPNRFADNQNDKPEYNTIDATLWLFVSLYHYFIKFGDAEFIKDNIHNLDAIFEAHIIGTHYQIRVTEQGFLFGGEGVSQLTWMDARIGDYVVTPRHGCPVEIQALWYNALQVYLFFGKEFPDVSMPLKSLLEKLSQKIKTNFLPFFLTSDGYLKDVVDRNLNGDAAIRPNQLYTLSLPFPLVDKNTGIQILKIVDSHLFTPYGLRTLSPESIHFVPTYNGNQWNRDSAYHQGTVWPFLLSDYFQACLFVYGKTEDISSKLNQSIKILSKHFYESGCIHGIAEIFDGLNPDYGKGTVQQAWSVSAVIQLQLMNLT